jgi:hypothetical protein
MGRNGCVETPDRRLVHGVSGIGRRRRAQVLVSPKPVHMTMDLSKNSVYAANKPDAQSHGI